MEDGGKIYNDIEEGCKLIKIRFLFSTVNGKKVKQRDSLRVSVHRKDLGTMRPTKSRRYRGRRGRRTKERTSRVVRVQRVWNCVESLSVEEGRG